MGCGEERGEWEPYGTRLSSATFRELDSKNGRIEESRFAVGGTEGSVSRSPEVDFYGPESWRNHPR